MEPILGAGGVIPPHHSFAPMVSQICEKNGILLITDEVITAYGRTGAWSGARLWGIQPDMMCTAKAITNGYFPFGALMLGHKMVEVFEDNPSAKIGHGYTRGGHGLMTAIEMVSDRASKKPIDADTATTVQEVTYQTGAMVRVSGPNLILSPPLVVTEQDCTTILTALDAGFKAA